jgi:hypothetical protein
MQILHLKNNIKNEIINTANKEIAKIKLYYHINKKITIEYLPYNNITNMLTALEDINEKEFLSLIEEIKNYKVEIFNKEYPIIENSFGFISIISCLDIPF